MEPNVKRIIKLSRTSDNDLLSLARLLGVKIDQIDFKEKMKRTADYAILNMGNPLTGGSHWIAVSSKHKMYFDPLGLPRPRVIPKSYSYREFSIQNPQYGHCGQYCVLWLYYLQHGRLDDFYKLFKRYSSGSLLDDDTEIHSKAK